MDERANLIMALGAYFLGAVYLAGVIAAGLVWGNHNAVHLAVFAAGVGYVVQIAQAPLFRIPDRAIMILWCVVLLAASGGGILLVV